MTDHLQGEPSRHRSVDHLGRERPFGPHVSDWNATILDRYRFIDNIPLRGFLINGRPALTQIDPEQIGDFVIVVVRDPLCDYDKDPAEQFAGYLENATLAGKSGMFTTYTGHFKGARISVISGGS